MLLPKQNRIRDKKHRQFIASLPCCVSGASDVQAAHIRSGCFSAGMKPCDSLTVPLSVSEHRRQGEIGEEAFWGEYGGIDKAKELARDLYEHTGNTSEALRLIAEFR